MTARTVHPDTVLVVLWEKGADRGPVRWVRVALRTPGGYATILNLADRGLVTVFRDGPTNPGIQLTPTGATHARCLSALLVLVKAGADQRPVPWDAIPDTVTDLRERRLVVVTGAGIRLTAAGRHLGRLINP